MRKVQKEVLTDATDKNFFNLFFKAQSVTLLIGYFGQFVSGITEFHFVFSAAQGIYKPFLVWSNFVPMILGLLAVYIFEFLGVRVYLVRIVRQIANKEFVSRESWILFVFNVLFVLALCGSNLWFSVLGQTASFHSLTNVRVTDKTFGLDSLKNIEIAKVTTKYSQKGSLIRNDHNRQTQEKTLHYDGIVNENRTNRWTVSDDKQKYDAYTVKIDTTLAQKNRVLIALDAKLNKELVTLETNKTTATERIETTYDKRIDDIEGNTTAQADLWAMVQRYTKPILVVFILLSWVSIIYAEVFFKGSGQSVEVKELSFRPILVWVLIVGLYDKFYHWFYNKVVKLIGLDRFRYGQIRTNEIAYKAETAIKPTNEHANKPSIAANVRQIGFNKSDNNEYQNNSISPNIQNLGSNTANYTATVPTEYQLDTEAIQQNNGERNNGERRKLAANERTCKNCSSVFTYKHWNARYCSDTCRIENWENRTGRKLNKGRKK
jgi:hypothetical protein